MKKTAIAIFTSLALMLGVGALGESAQAVYPNTVATTAQITRKAPVTERHTFHVTVKVDAGNATISSGKVILRFNSQSHTESVKNGKATFTLKAPSVRRTTRKTIRAKYYQAAGSIFKNSPTTATVITVKNN